MVKKYFLMLSVILFVSFASAGFTIGNASHSIDKSYAPEGTIKGWVNLSFTDEPGDSVFESSTGNSIELLELLEKNNAEYSCNPSGCGLDYSANAGGNGLIFNLEKGKEKTIGFKLTGIIDEITSAKFKVESTATSSCENQLKIDFFGEGVIFLGNNKSINENCPLGEDHGCFNEAQNKELYIVGTTPYCQKINLTEAPGFVLGAWVSEVTKGNKKLTMSLYDSYGDKVKSCDLSGFSSAGEEISCNVDYPLQKPEVHYVCISGDGGTGTYKIRGYSAPNSCGFYGAPIKSYTNAYQIFATGKKFGDFGTLEITNSIYDDEFGILMEDYILEKYKSFDCSEGCIIPIKFVSTKNQTITLKELQINYEEVGGQRSETKFYELGKTATKINSGFQKLYLDYGSFSVPASYGNSTFTLNFNNEKIFSQTISVDKTIPVINGVAPTTIAAAVPAKFKVNVNSTSNITKYEWAFGNEIKITSVNKITHTFNSIGNYQLKITVTDSNKQSSSKTFDIEVISPKEAINTTLNQNFENLVNIKSQINSFSGFYKDSLNLLIDAELIEETLKQIEEDYNNASSDSEYIEIMTELAELRIPFSVSISRSAKSIPFYPDEKSVDLDIVQAIGGGTYKSEEENKYTEAVLAWFQENIKSEISFDEISANYEEGQENLLNFFEIDIKEKNILDYDYYLVLNLENANFEENYNEKEGGGYFYLTPSQKIVFSTTEGFDFTNLPAFISPEINKLTISNIGEVLPPGEESKWGLFTAVIIGILIIALIVYIILQQWYKHKYENHLFNDRNNLLNLIHYIDNATKKGLNENEIDERLKKAGWNSEQREYALKKYAGKRTGMFELPITKILEKLKKDEDKEITQGKIPTTR